LTPRSAIFVCMNEAVMTDGHSVADSKTVRRISKGEMLEAMELERKDESVNVPRVKCKAKRDGKTGWVTILGNAGKAFLEHC